MIGNRFIRKAQFSQSFLTMPANNVTPNAVRGDSSREAVCDWLRNSKVYARVQHGNITVV